MSGSDRIVWAVETLAIQPRDRVLEVGCGQGHAVSLICEQLKSGIVAAVDQSAKMIQAARKNNKEHVASGRAALLNAALLDADLGSTTFNKIFTINVNRPRAPRSGTSRSAHEKIFWRRDYAWKK